MRIIPIFQAAAGLVLAAAPVFAADRQLMVTDFDRIMVEGPYTVTVTQSRATAARASGTPQALDGVDISVIGKTLRVRPRKSGWGERGKAVHQAASIAITSPNLRFAALTGPGSLTVKGVKSLKADLSVNGSGTLTAVGVAADRLALTVRGAATAVISGVAGTVVADVSGSSALDTNNLKAQDIQVTAQSSGDVHMAAVRSAKIVSVGAGDVIISGRPACDVNNAGSGSIQCAEAPN